MLIERRKKTLFTLLELKGSSFDKPESPSPKDALWQVWLKLAQRFWRRNFWISSMYFCYFVIISPWKRAGPSFEQIWIPVIQGCIVPSLVEIGPLVLEKKIFKFCQCIFAIALLSPLGKGWGPLFEQTWVLISQECFVPSLVEIGLFSSGEEIFEFRQCIFAIS